MAIAVTELHTQVSTCIYYLYWLSASISYLLQYNGYDDDTTLPYLSLKHYIVVRYSALICFRICGKSATPTICRTASPKGPRGTMPTTSEVVGPGWIRTFTPDAHVCSFLLLLQASERASERRTNTSTVQYRTVHPNKQTAFSASTVQYNQNCTEVVEERRRRVLE